MKTIKIMWALMLVAFIGLTGCKKEGCTDPDSITYNSEARKDNGTCFFEGSAVIWYGNATATELVNDGAIILFYYVNGELVGSGASSVYWINGVSPDCGQNASITITKDLGSVKTQSYTYSVVDQTGYQYWNGIVNINANECFALELIW